MAATEIGAKARMRWPANMQAALIYHRVALHTVSKGHVFALILELCVCPKIQKASAVVTGEAMRIKLVAGTGFEPVTFRL